MPLSFLSTLFEKRAAAASGLAELAALFSQMDAAYDAVAAGYGFVCNGCDDNCCTTRFFHHTVAELLSVFEGVCRLPPADRNRIREAAHAVIAADPESRPMCPANIDGRCRIYAHRPMICRLHGPASEIHHPVAGIKRFPGCQAFHDHCGDADYRRFDRTAYYRRMVAIEQHLKQVLGVSLKPRMTVAEMITAFPIVGEDGGREGECP